MINDLIIKLIQLFDGLYDSFGVSTLFEELLEKAATFETYTTDFSYYLGGLYFVFGKPLIVFIVGVFSVVFMIRLVMSIVNIVGQFIP